MRGDIDKLNMWRERLEESKRAYGELYELMDERERLYNKDRRIRTMVEGDVERDGTLRQTPHVRNIIFENIEAQVSSISSETSWTASPSSR